MGGHPTMTTIPFQTNMQRDHCICDVIGITYTSWWCCQPIEMCGEHVQAYIPPIQQCLKLSSFKMHIPANQFIHILNLKIDKKLEIYVHTQIHSLRNILCPTVKSPTQ